MKLNNHGLDLIITKWNIISDKNINYEILYIKTVTLFFWIKCNILVLSV